MPQSSEQKELAYQKKLDMIMRTECYNKVTACFMARKYSWKMLADLFASDIVIMKLARNLKAEDLQKGYDLQNT